MHALLHHMSEHFWAWVAGAAVLGAGAIPLGLTTPASFLFMFVGLLVMMRAEGTSLERIIEEDPTLADTLPAEEPVREAA